MNPIQDKQKQLIQSLLGKEITRFTLKGTGAVNEFRGFMEIIEDYRKGGADRENAERAMEKYEMLLKNLD